ncbi:MULTISPECIES: RHS repeat-associated core domain-containing protein [Burkholderia]|uniref:RHS repeat-associated core domain-containing protein n=1 Tax=Burkholderia TaxID=32008 RepID=UPI00041A23D6|nr:MULTISPECIES: RHS repeat-associated core domain-containing protein [Burkholderia]
MALPAVKHLDPVVGVDVHSVLVTPGTPPVFLPHPHVGFMLDLREYVQAAKAVVGCIAMMVAQEKVTEYIEDHPEDVKKLEHLADEANQQVNELMGGGKLPDFKDDPTVAEGMKFAKEANKIKNRISNDLGSNVGSGGSSGRPIFVNGMMRATAGTHAYHVPGLHFPLGESFAPPPADFEPSNDGESFMGSKTVLANNDPMSYMALEALSCWSIGMEPPPHNSAHTDRTYPSMPSSVMLPIPAGRPVLVGGPPIMNMAAAAKGLFKAFRGSKWAKALADKLHLKPGFLKCKVLDAEPVDSITGEVIVQEQDFTIAGRLPLVWDRYYASRNIHRGAIGVGWQTPADIRLELIHHLNGVGISAHFPDHSTAFDAIPNTDGSPMHIYDWQYGYFLYRRGECLVLRTRAGIEHEFVLSTHSQHAIETLRGNTSMMLPVKRVRDLNGNSWEFERGSEGNLVRLVEWKGEVTSGRRIECDACANSQVEEQSRLLTALTLIDADGHAHPLVTYEHDRNGNLLATRNAMGQPHLFAYTDSHRMVRHTSARGISFYYSHLQHSDGIWRVDHAWGENRIFDYHFVYDVKHHETRITNSLGHTTTLQANERGIPIARIDSLGGIWSYRSDTQGRANAETDPAGQTTIWTYDLYGNLLDQTLPDYSSIRVNYNDNHKPLHVTDTGTRQWQFTWDDRGNLIEQISPTRARSQYDYDSLGQLVSHTGPCGAVTRFAYDRDGNLTEVVNALGHRARYTYDARAHIIHTINALNQVSRYEYDRNGDLTRAIEPGDREISCSYDADGNLVRYRDPSGLITQFERSSLGQITKRLAPDGSVVEYRYDTEDQLIGVVNERGELYQLKRDALGQIVEEVDYWGQSRHYKYRATGELLRSVDPIGQTIEYETDALGRVVQRRLADPRQPGGFRTETFSYDCIGRLNVAENSNTRVELKYDAAGRVVQEKQGSDFTIASEYDSAGNRIERRTCLNTGGRIVTHTVRYKYDMLDLVSSIQIDDAEPIMFERDTLGRIRTEQLGAELCRELSYTSEGLLAKQTLISGTGVLSVNEYVHDANGELLEKRDSRLGLDLYHYDPVGRLTEHLEPVGQLRRFLYDPAGDLLKTRVRHEPKTGAFDQKSKTYIWAREGEYDGFLYTYNRAGDLIQKQGVNQNLILHWDASGQLVEVDSLWSTSSPMDGYHTIYEYDAFQRRVRKIVKAKNDRDESTAIGENVNASSYECRYYWDAATMIADSISSIDEKSQDNCPNFKRQIYQGHEWIYYPETFQILAALYCSRQQQGGLSSSSTDVNYISGKTLETQAPCKSIVYLFDNNPNGAPVRVYDHRGTLVWEARYGALGKILEIKADDIDQSIRLQGQFFDRESGLHYNRHRYYDPDIGIFISQDPIGIVGGLNPYQFAPNSFRWTDPTGLERDFLNRVRATITIGNGKPRTYESGSRGHAEQDAFFANLLNIKNQHVTLTDIEGDYRSNSSGDYTLPATICTVRCRSELFWGAHIGDAASLTFPMVINKTFRRNVTINRSHFKYLAEEMTRIEKSTTHAGSRAKKQWDAITRCEQGQCSHP